MPNLIMVILFVGLIYACYRSMRAGAQRKEAIQSRQNVQQRVNDLTDRVQVLEALLIDQDRRWRDDFGRS